MFFQCLPISLLGAEKKLTPAEIHEQYLEHYRNGEQAKEFGAWDIAVQEFSEALNLEPENPIARKNLILIEKLRHYREIRALIRDGLKNYHENQFLDALFNFNQVIQLDPGNIPIQNIIQLIQQNANNAAKLSSVPDGDRLYSLAMDDYIESRWESAAERWRTVLKLNPTHYRAADYLRKAQIKIWEKKRKEKSQTLTEHQRQADNTAQKGFMYYMLGETENAIQSWKKALEIDPENKDARHALQIIGNYQNRAEGEQLFPQNGSVDQLSSEALKQYAQGHLREAVKIWRKALSWDPYNINIKNNIKRVETEMAIKSHR